MIAEQIGSSLAGFQPVVTLLFFLEIYHSISHLCVLFRIRLLPKKDLIRVKYYFLVDLLTVTCSAAYTRKVIWLAALQNLQHLYFFTTWNKSSYCIRVIEWSSLDWMVKRGSSKDKDSVVKANHTDRTDVTLGTFFDMVVHMVYVYYLSAYIHVLELVVSLGILIFMTKFVLYNKKLAWASPDQVPKWVARRVSDIFPSEKQA